MALSKTLVPPLLSLIASFLLLMQLANKVHSQSDSTTFAYSSFAQNSPNLTYQGDALVPQGASYLRLTRTDTLGNPQDFSVGRVVFTPTVVFWRPGQQATFQTNIRFLISAIDNNPADGIVFFIAPVNFPVGAPAGSFGVFNPAGNANSVFAVEFDTYFQGDNSAWDPPYRHIGININSRASREVMRYDTLVGQEVAARINYDSSTRTVTVEATVGSQGPRQFSYVIDLKTVLPQQVQVGISSATGDFVAIHDLRQWSFTSTLVQDTNNVVGCNEKNAEGSYIRQYV